MQETEERSYHRMLKLQYPKKKSGFDLPEWVSVPLAILAFPFLPLILLFGFIGSHLMPRNRSLLVWTKDLIGNLFAVCCVVLLFIGLPVGFMWAGWHEGGPVALAVNALFVGLVAGGFLSKLGEKN